MELLSRANQDGRANAMHLPSLCPMPKPVLRPPSAVISTTTLAMKRASLRAPDLSYSLSYTRFLTTSAYPLHICDIDPSPNPRRARHG